MNNKLKEKIISKIETGISMSPFLFLGKNLPLLHEKLYDFIADLEKKFDTPRANLYLLEDDEQNIKIEKTRNLLAAASIKSPYKIQIFLIENIGRFTLGSANSLLKFLEEPNVGTVIFLTNTSESQVLDTILSRVESVAVKSHFSIENDAFFQSLLDGEKQMLLAYFYKNKLEKEEYLRFLQTLLHYKGTFQLSPKNLEKLQEDITAIQKNNVSVKYIVDKWILKIC